MAHWLRPKPATMASFFAGADTRSPRKADPCARVLHPFTSVTLCANPGCERIAITSEGDNSWATLNISINNKRSVCWICWRTASRKDFPIRTASGALIRQFSEASLFVGWHSPMSDAGSITSARAAPVSSNSANSAKRRNGSAVEERVDEPSIDS